MLMDTMGGHVWGEWEAPGSTVNKGRRNSRLWSSVGLTSGSITAIGSYAQLVGRQRERVPQAHGLAVWQIINGAEVPGKLMSLLKYRVLIHSQLGERNVQGPRRIETKLEGRSKSLDYK